MSQKIEAVKGKSPYAKHAKAPYKYSEHYDRWTSAVTRFGRYSEEAIEADLRFRKVFGVPTVGINSQLDGVIL